MRVAGSRPQGPVGQVSRRLGARAPRAWGPAHQGPGAFSPQKPPNLSNYDFFANVLVGAWRRRGCRLKRLLRRWGPGGKRSRDTPPTPPPPHPPPRFGAVREKGFHPLRLRQPSNTPPKVGGPSPCSLQSTFLPLRKHFYQYRPIYFRLLHIA